MPSSRAIASAPGPCPLDLPEAAAEEIASSHAPAGGVHRHDPLARRLRRLRHPGGGCHSGHQVAPEKLDEGELEGGQQHALRVSACSKRSRASRAVRSARSSSPVPQARKLVRRIFTVARRAGSGEAPRAASMARRAGIPQAAWTSAR